MADQPLESLDEVHDYVQSNLDSNTSKRFSFLLFGFEFSNIHFGQQQDFDNEGWTIQDILAMKYAPVSSADIERSFLKLKSERTAVRQAKFQ
ncbi:hypothetical protein M8J77_020026 [Diaphorina citri]|nr:hypothetical protein M8J77_020026 [Diaphorina citri]